MAPPTQSSLQFFDLIQPVGRGAMGEVWLAKHQRGGARVAIKFLHVKGAQSAAAAEALSNEVQACARLAHPNIVTVLDHGIVPQGGHQAGDHHFGAGTAFLVMEFVPGRSLQSVVGRLRWPRMREVLVVLLDALAHSHARSVIHRDLKPGNVLLRQAPLSAAPGRAPEPLLTDFGVAQAFTEGALGTREVVGTPAYMAPEQLQARWRDQGPWTDLYSMGCLAWSLATGTPPFGRGRTFEENRAAHLLQPPPAFQPVMPVPAGLEGWLRRLLVKDPAHRYVRAADALLGLLALPPIAPDAAPPAPQVPAAPVLEIEDEDEELSGHGPDTLTLSSLHAAAADRPRPPRSLTAEDLGAGLPPRVTPRSLPADWRSPRPPAIPPQLLGVGLNLYGLREPPLVDREAEREALWAELRALEGAARPRAVLLQGPSGCGASRLADWLAERAHELGAALVLRSWSHGDEGSGAEVGRMLARHFRVEGMSAAPRQRRLHRLLAEHGVDQPDELRALAELVGPGDGEQTAPTSLAHPSERYRLLSRLLQAIATGPEGPRSLLMVLDDAQWSPDALGLARHLLDHAASTELPVLLVLTAGTDGLPERPALRRRFDAVRDHARTRVVPVHPLSTEHQTELVRLLLGMEGGLAARVVRRSAGNPHYAVELIRDWVQEGKLRIGSEGFELQPFADIDMPKDLQQTWRAQVERQLARLEPEEVRALELAAALGNDVDADEWHAVCALTGTNPSPRLLAVLLRNRMARMAPEGQGWSFVNPMYRELLAVRSRNAGRHRRIHLACARMLEFKAGRVPGVAERLARHLLKANQPIPAAPQLLQAAQERLERGQTVEAERLIEVRDKLLKRLRLPTEDALWGQGWVQKARLYRMTDRKDRARDLALRALQSAHRHRWEGIAAAASAELEALDGGPAEITPIG